MIVIDSDRVHELLTVGSLVEPMRQAFASQARSPPRIHYELEADQSTRTLLIMPAWNEEAIGAKIATVFSRNGQRDLPSISGVYVLFSGRTGLPRAIIDGRAMTLLRTAAVSALAADVLVQPDPRVLLMVGTGALARYLIEGHMAVRPYESILIWGRNRLKAQAIASTFDDSGTRIDVVTNLESAARTADVICCATMAEQPIIQGAWLKGTSHLDLVGSYKPTMRESDGACWQDAVGVVDTLDALSDSGDLIAPLSNNLIKPDAISLLGNIVANPIKQVTARRSVFKSVGVALADLAVAERLVAAIAGKSAAAVGN